MLCMGKRGRKARAKAGVGVGMAGEGELGNGPPQIGGACGEGGARRRTPATELCERHTAEFL